MKTFHLTTMIFVFLLLCSIGIQAQTTQTESLKAGSEYNVLDAWSGFWTIQGDARDSISAPYYHVDWTLKGQRILNSYAIEIFHQWKTKNFTQNGVEITGYDPQKKVCMTHIFYDDGSWLNSTPVFTGNRTCIENGTSYYPNGKTDIWRCTWNFSDDWMSLTVKCEDLKNANWLTLWELKGTKDNKK
ncbi:MAG: hypothetical protein ABSA76_10150 [Bacteroidales bacterium]